MMEEMGNASESAGGILINAPSTGDSFGVRLTDSWLMAFHFAVRKLSRSGISAAVLLENLLTVKTASQSHRKRAVIYR